MIGGVFELFKEGLLKQKIGLELWFFFCEVISFIDGILQLIELFKLFFICDDVFDFIDVGFGVGVLNIYVRYWDVEIVRFYNSIRRNRIYRVRNDLGQNEVERINVEIGEF